MVDPNNEVLRHGVDLEAHRPWRQESWNYAGQRQEEGMENEPCKQSVFMEPLCL